MTVQFVTLPAEPLSGLSSDYGNALIRLAWDRTGQIRRLLFASVELLPTEVPRPVDDGEHWCRFGGNSAHYGHIRTVVTDATRAVQWYRDAVRGAVVRPEDDGSLPPADAVGVVTLAALPLSEEPQWPEMALAKQGVPFLASWHHPARVHHLLPRRDPMVDVWTTSERDRALAWLHDHLHFRLEEFPEYLGSAHLVAPNPVYRALAVRLRPAQSGSLAEAVAFRFAPRTGRSVQGLQLTVRTERPTGSTAVVRVPVEEAGVVVHFPADVDRVAYHVEDTPRGVLEESEPTSFLREFRLQMALISATREVHVPATDGRPEEVYRVPVSRDTETRGAQEDGNNTTDARALLYRAQETRRQRLHAQPPHQAWFSGEDDERRATQIVRGYLQRAQRSVLIVDGYFGAVELIRYGLAVAHAHVPIRVLSSAKVLRQPSQTGSPRERGEELLATLERIGGESHANPVEARVMPGEEPEVHDRFLAVDAQVWLLGSSLNRFGHRGTMLVALAAPEPVQHVLEDVWSRAETLANWVATRRSARSGQTGGAP